MSKKEIKIRKFWTINPITKIKESKKIYKRAREKRKIKNEKNSFK